MMDIHLNKMCRICLKEGDNFNPIFSNDKISNSDVSISSKIMACSSIQVIAGDGLPELICHECLKQVDVAYDFREKCQSADAALRKYIPLVEPLYRSVEKSNQVPVKLEESHLFLPEVDSDASFSLQNPKKESNLVKEVKDFPESANNVPVTVLPTKKKREYNKSKKPKKCQDEDSTSEKKRTKDEKDVKCPICKKTFAYLCILKDHMVQHTGAKPYLCSACGKSFGHTASLTNHMKTHYSDKPHKCDRCELSFHRRVHLVLHMRTHTGEKPFVCDVCGRDFAQNSYLKEHMRVHSGEKPFVCDICGHGFARKSCLVMHRRVHTGELPYACPECGRAFSQRSQRKRHVKRNHKGSACLRATGELIMKDLDLKNKNSNQEELLNENSLNENSLTDGSLNLQQDGRLMTQYQQQQQQQQPQQQQGNNSSLLIYQQENISNLYPSSVMPLPLIQIQTALLQ